MCKYLYLSRVCSHCVVSPQVVYVFGGSHSFRAVDCDEVEYVPSNVMGVAQWFGVTAFLFCVHSMVSISFHCPDNP